MIVIYNNGVSKKYFETEYSDRITIPDKVYQANTEVDVSKYDYVIGNNLYLLPNPSPSQTYIDVIRLGLSYELLEKYTLESIVYVYNNWYIPNDPYMNVHIPVGSYMIREPTSHDIYVKIGLVTDNKRFNQIREEISKSIKDPSFVGAQWPTCHYLSMDHYMILVFSRRSILYTKETKPLLRNNLNFNL